MNGALFALFGGNHHFAIGVAWAWRLAHPRAKFADFGARRTQHDGPVDFVSVAIAEGFAFPGAPQTSPSNIPNSRRNPGNIRDMNRPPDYPVKTFATVEEGWQALYQQVERMLAGSSLYPANWTISQVAQRYTGEAAYANWARIVAGRLGVSVDTVFSEIV